jgi:membrane protein DedA with SNARE-associated domain
LAHTIDFIVRHGYLLLFLWVLAEQGALPAPSLPLLLACGALAHDGRLNPVLVILSGAAACMTADNIWFQLGRRRGSKALRFICRVSIEPDSCVRRTEATFKRLGSRALLVGKFVPGLSTVMSPLAALSGMSQVRFLVFDTLGALAWIVSFAGLGYIFHNQLDDVADYLERMGKGFVALAAGLLAAWIAWKVIQRRRFLRQLDVARIEPEELQAKIEAGEAICVVDVRHSLEQDEPIPGALRIPLEELDERYREIPRDRDVILFCT